MAKKVENIIVILGNTNNTEGEISDIAKQRCLKGYEIWKKNEKQFILVTGAFGKHFNVTKKPHSNYLIDFLKRKGIPDKQFLKPAFSSNTTEDILYVSEKYEKFKPTKIVLVTSDFHAKRVELLCSRLLYGHNYSVEKVITTLPQKELLAIQKSEAKSYKMIKEEILYFPQYRAIKKFPLAIYNNADREHKHYDYLSQAIIAGIIAIFSLGNTFYFQFLDDKGIFIKLLISIQICVLVVILHILYEKFARTARIARIALTAVEFRFTLSGFSSLYSLKRDKNYTSAVTWVRILTTTLLFCQVLIFFISNSIMFKNSLLPGYPSLRPFLP